MQTVAQNQGAWKSRDAWLCALTLIVFQVVMLFCLRVVARSSPAFDHWWASPFGKGVIYLISDLPWLVVPLWFSRVRTVREFLEPAGLRRGLTLFGWCAAWLAIGIAFIDGYGASRGWTASSREHHSGYGGFSVAWCYFTLSAVVIAPFCEEVATRGFLYRSFRGRYGFILTTVIIICFSAFFHRSSVSRSLFTFGCLAALWVLLCAVRETSGSLWDCLLCHAVYNMVGLHLWIQAVVVVLLFLPIVIYPIYAKRRETILAAPNRDA
jgi:membrane protease YdiL (CAAX protease family)